MSPFLSQLESTSTHLCHIELEAAIRLDPSVHISGTDQVWVTSGPHFTSLSPRPLNRLVVQLFLSPCDLGGHSMF